MKAEIEVDLNSDAIRDILRSHKVRQELERRAHLIAAAAGEGHEVTSDVGINRADAEVIAVSFQARYRQARNNNLVRSIDAGRG